MSSSAADTEMPASSTGTTTVVTSSSSSDPTIEPGSTTTSGDDSDSGTTTGHEGTTTKESGSGEEESSDTTSTATPCMDACVAEAPDGWVGPHAQSATPGNAGDTGCGGGFPNSVADGVTSVSGAAAICSCSCGPPSGGECEDPLTISIYDQDTATGCNNLTQTITTAQTPYTDSDGDSGIYVVIDTPDVEAAPTCAPAASESVPAIEYGDPVELCGGVFGAGECGADEVCVPELSASFVSSYCVYSDGDVPCPVGSEYSQRTVYFTDEVDSRECSSCSCGAAQGVGCSGSVEFNLFYSGSGFNEDEVEPANGTCRSVIPNGTATSSVVYGIEYDPNDPFSSGCSANGGNPVGSVSEVGAFTVCCTP